MGKGSEGLLTDSMQILSLDTAENEVRAIAVPRSVVAPEIARFRSQTRFYMANQAFPVAGMELTEKMIEDATGLSADFLMVIDMEFLTRMIEDVFDDELEVCIPWEIDDVNMGYFPAGLQTLTGDEILAVSRARYYGTYFNRDSVQQYVLKAILRRFRTELGAGNLSAIQVMAKGMLFFQRELADENIQANFNFGVGFDIARELVGQLTSGQGEGEAAGFGMPQFAARYEFSTENNWDMDDTTRRRPIGGNPWAADLVTGYWFNARAEVRDFLLQANPGTGFEEESQVCGISQP
jgi:LCP family protein required for cell wall assembly